MDGFTYIAVEAPRPGVLLVRLNRPEKLNALSKALVGELAAALERASRDPDVRCVVITGAGKAFCAGADIQEMAERGVEAYADEDRLRSWRALESFEKPLIAAVNGYALGGGCELAMLCDIIIASETARFGQAEINIGVLPGDGGTQRLPRLVGPGLAMRMILTGEAIDAAEAERRGLITEMTRPDDTVDRAMALAAQIAEKSPVAVRLAKQAVRQAQQMPLAQGLLFEHACVREAFHTEDQKEGMRAFLEKRAPKFRGS